MPREIRCRGSSHRENLIVQRDPLLDVEDQTTKSLRHEEVKKLSCLFFVSLCLGGSFPLNCGELP